jgi:hypothetical protein
MRALIIAGSLLTAGLLLSGCDSDQNVQSVQSGASTSASTTTSIAPAPAPVAKYAYKVSLQNVTLSQPMAPMAVAYHSKDVSVFEVGQSASLGLEKLAEDGDNSMLLLELLENILVEANKGGNGLILPSKSDTVTIEGTPTECLSVTAMLVNTNDAFAGVDCVDVSKLNNGEILSIELPVYDAGTEANSEEASTIPGPAGGGEGFNTERDDRDFVVVHSGAITKDDGLSTSALTQSHKWNNPAAMLTIERIK